MFDIIPIPAFADNYIWLLKSEHSSNVAVIDPGDASPVLERLHNEQLSLGAILITHHHQDHTGGISKLKSAFPNAKVYGPAHESIPAITDRLTEGAEVKLPWQSDSLKVFDMPGHTAGHIAYAGDNLLFCGDTLFAASHQTIDELGDHYTVIAHVRRDFSFGWAIPSWHIISSPRY